ncbi:PLP-dependent aminotransferase family protein [Dyella kyungheensis]|uniref:PLP-dependent aminotransferase family protein n=1 Tax=Dyella kyungheensis TaxID=1242174 RepID=A0ABS2JSH8_9GAMM|nr:PLP-dependent aminotransferase family protein [Dyella kyungheensis]MBM7121961.1 PLP-dependent aminotransferase family protein [Dyella kyungheensis]
MDIQLTISGRRDLAGQLYQQLRAAIVEGRLAPGSRLPSSRDLAVQLGVSRKTTLEVFERLGAEGFLIGRQGDGSFVATGFTPMPSKTRARSGVSPKPAKVWRRVPPTLAMPRVSERLRYDYLGGVTDKSLFHADVWRKCIAHALRAQARGRGIYRDPAGEQELRLAIARYLGFNRAVACDWQEVMVTQGAQQAIDLAVRVMVDRGDVVVMEEPGYPPARSSMLAMGARVKPVRVDEEGLCVDELPDEARLVYVTPSHQFPLGMPMSLERRMALLEWASRRGALIVEDDYDGEFRFEGRPLESLKSLDRNGVVAYIGTFSKTLFPELRIGYVVPPPSLADEFLKAKQITDWHGCSLTQAALGRYMLDGEFGRHLRRMQKHYAERRLALLQHLRGPLSPWLEPIVPAAGIHMTAMLRKGVHEDALIAKARAASLALYGIRRFYAGRHPRQGLQFGYGDTPVHDIHTSMQLLASLLHGQAAEDPPGHSVTTQKS